MTGFLTTFGMTLEERHSEADAEESSASCIAIQEMTGFFTTFRMTLEERHSEANAEEKSARRIKQGCLQTYF